MHDDVAQIQAAIAALEAQRAVLGEAVVETVLGPLREKLAALQQPENQDERKRVSVLFADVQGYTAMSENLDPEEVTLLMNRLFDALTAEITRFGGSVDKYSGDAVMALFGAPRALENHEEMAVRAALAMQEATGTFSSALEQERGLELALRIGINTGEVMAGMVGGLGSRSYTVMGDTVNLAARLEHACPPGRVLMSAATARPIEAVFDFEPPQQITVKGKTEPITVYLVAGEKAERGRVRGLAGLHAPLIGRETELAGLQQAYNEAITGAKWGMAAIVGEAGIGKTRLRREFVAWATQAAKKLRLLTARSYAHTQNNPYHLVNELMRTLFGIDEEMEGPVAMAHLEAGLQIMFPIVGPAEFQYLLGSLASVLGVALSDNPLAALEPEQRRDRIFLSLEKMLLVAATLAPLLLVVEDLHWADSLSLAFLERLVQTVEGTPDQSAFLLIVTRPPEREGEPFALLLERFAGRQVYLSSLDDIQAGALIEALLDQSLPSDLLHQIARHTQGNPLFVEEVLRAFIEEETLVQEEGEGWRLTRAVADLDVPPTVQDLLTARLDRLPPSHKQVVQYAAIVGRTFWQQLLGEILPAGCVNELEPVLDSLQARQLIQRLQQSQLAGDWEWAFHHVLIQEVAYTGLPRRLRRQVHRQVGHELESAVEAREEGGRGRALLPRIAFHYEHGDEPGKAVHFLHRAGELAAGQYANEAAVGYFSRALELLDEVEGDTKEQQFELLLGREAVYSLLGERQAQQEDLEQLEELSDRLGEKCQAAVALRLAGYYDAISDSPTAVELAKKVIDLAETSGALQYRFQGQIAWARALWKQGQFDEARRHLEDALAVARTGNDEAGEATSRHHLGTILTMLGDYPKAQNHLEGALAIRLELGDQRNSAATLANLGGLFIGLGDLASARSCTQQSLDLYRSIGHRQYEAMVLANLASLHHAVGELPEALDLCTKALTLSQVLGDVRLQAITLNNLSLIYHDLEHYEQARYYVLQALDLNHRVGDRQGEGFSLTYFGLTLEGLEEWTTALKIHNQALELRRSLGQEGYAIDNLAGLARVALRQNHLDEALRYAKEILEWIEENNLQGSEYPLRVYVTIADVFEEIGQSSEAARFLKEAENYLINQASHISDERVRKTFLEQVPVHKQLEERLSSSEEISRQ